jgi:aspartyl-tRNA(Asn)/glutamyl-tRNA(Gln) amidotransferase subunit B
MEEGSMRVDANVSLNRPGDPWGTRCEIKNLNSVRSLGRAIEFEARRQAEVLEAGGSVAQETRHWNEEDGRTHSMRSKEEAFDYRYFPEPDLVRLDPSAGWIEQVGSALPTLPAERRAALAEACGVSAGDVALVVERDLDSLVAGAVAEGADPRRALTHAEHNLPVESATDLPFGAEGFAALVKMETAGDLTATQAKQVLAEMAVSGGSPAEIAAAKGFEAMGTGELESVVDQIIADHPDEWSRFCDGEDKLQGLFVGAVMKATGGNADGGEVTALLRARRGR